MKNGFRLLFAKIYLIMYLKFIDKSRRCKTVIIKGSNRHLIKGLPNSATPRSSEVSHAKGSIKVSYYFKI